MSQTPISLTCNRCPAIAARGQHDGQKVWGINTTGSVNHVLKNGMQIKEFMSATVIHPVAGVEDRHTIA